MISKIKRELKIYQQQLNQSREFISIYYPGEWLKEPDRHEWKSNGFQCLLVRAPVTFAWCGYVGLTKEHRDYGKDYQKIKLTSHGGLTYGDYCQGVVCHKGDQDEKEKLYWLGFDCAHCFDIVPAVEAFRKCYDKNIGTIGIHSLDAWAKRHLHYRDFQFAKLETEKLASKFSKRW